MLVMPTFAQTIEEHTQDKGLTSFLLGISTSRLPPPFPLPSLPLSLSLIYQPTNLPLSLLLSLPLPSFLTSLLPFLFSTNMYNYLFYIRPYAIKARNTMLKKRTVCSQEA